MMTTKQKYLALMVLFMGGCTPDLLFEEPSSEADIFNADTINNDVALTDVYVEQDILSPDIAQSSDGEAWLDIVGSDATSDTSLMMDVVDVEEWLDVSVSEDVWTDTWEDTQEVGDAQVVEDTSTPPEPDVVIEEDIALPPCPPCDGTCGEPCDGYPIRINEVTSKGKKEIELYNTSSITWYLAGFSMGNGQNMNQDENVFEFAQEDVIGPGEYLVLEKNNGHGLHLDERDALKLRSPLGEVLEYISWDRDADHSYCRIPDVSGDFKKCSEKTFGYPNVSN